MNRVVYDLSRLTTRVLNATPNGIDGIDRLLADHFLEDRQDTHTLLFGPLGPRLFPPGLLPNPTAALAHQWDAPSAVPDRLVAALRGAIAPGRPAQRLDFALPGRSRRIVGALGAYGLKFGAAPAKAAPRATVGAAKEVVKTVAVAVDEAPAKAAAAVRKPAVRKPAIRKTAAKPVAPVTPADVLSTLPQTGE